MCTLHRERNFTSAVPIVPTYTLLKAQSVDVAKQVMFNNYKIVLSSSFGSNNGLSPNRHQAIIWTNAGW